MAGGRASEWESSIQELRAEHAILQREFLALFLLWWACVCVCMCVFPLSSSHKTQRLWSTEIGRNPLHSLSSWISQTKKKRKMSIWRRKKNKSARTRIHAREQENESLGSLIIIIFFFFFIAITHVATKKKPINHRAVEWNYLLHYDSLQASTRALSLSSSKTRAIDMCTHDIHASYMIKQTRNHCWQHSWPRLHLGRRGTASLAWRNRRSASTEAWGIWPPTDLFLPLTWFLFLSPLRLPPLPPPQRKAESRPVRACPLSSAQAAQAEKNLKRGEGKAGCKPRAARERRATVARNVQQNFLHLRQALPRMWQPFTFGTKPPRPIHLDVAGKKPQEKTWG